LIDKNAKALYILRNEESKSIIFSIDLQTGSMKRAVAFNQVFEKLQLLISPDNR
jgi:hypothetical protein